MRDAQIIRTLEEGEGNKYLRMLEAVDIKQKLNIFYHTLNS